LDRVILRNAGSLLLIQGANFLLPLLTFPYLVRVLGPSNFGVLAFAFAVVAYGVMLADYGFNLSASKRIAEIRDDRPHVAKIFWSVSSAKALLGGLAFLMLVAASVLVPRLADIRPVLLAASPMILGSVLFPGWLFQGLERMSATSIFMIGAQALVVPLTFWLVKEPDDTWLATLIRACAPAAAGLAALAWLWRQRLVDWQRPVWADTRLALAEGWHIFISTAAISVYTTSNQVLLGFLCGPLQVGYYAAADRVRTAAQGVSSVLSNAVYPRVSALMRSDRPQALKLVRKLLLIQGAATLAGGCILWLGAPYIVSLLMGPAFEPSIAVLRWMAFVPFIVSLSNVFGIQLMLPLGMTRAFSRIVMGSAAFNLLLFVPLALHSGAVGGATALLLTEVGVTIAMGWIVNRHLKLGHMAHIRPRAGGPDEV
jgi:O-antigen/teichoic acid export membrane protein